MGQAFLALRWYLALQLFGLAALPLALRLFRHLPGRGYAFARPLGLLLGGWVFWLALTFGWLPNTAGAVLVALGLLAACGLAVWLPSAEKSAPFSWRHVLTVELLFAASLATLCLVRSYMPRIETAGGEKWMEIAFLNAVLRAPRFPPHDPWLSGFAISYYYFGYVIVGMLVRLAAVPSTVGFNLGIAALFALTCTGAYGLVYNLLAAEGRREATWGGLLGPLMVTVIGNLEGLLEVFHARGFFSASFWEWLDIRSINVPPPPFADGSWVPPRFLWWWQASRVLHDYAPWHTALNPAEWEVIDEFPAFSFLLGDMHPHVLALPFVLLALALALALFFRRSEPRPLRLWNLELGKMTLPLSVWELAVYALCLGGLGFLNTWDFPIYLFAVVASFALSEFLRTLRFRLSPLLLFGFLLAAGGFCLYLPFWIGLRSQASGITPNVFNGTRLPHFLVMFGPLLVPVAALVVGEARRRGVKGWEVAAWTAGAFLVLVLLLVLAGLVSPDARRYVAAWRDGGPIPGLEHIPEARQVLIERLRERLKSLWTPVTLAALLTGALLAAFRFRLSRSGQSGASGGEPRAPNSATASPFVLLMVITGSLLTLAVEFVYLRDIFGTRMNTVFKFYFQAWVVWGIAGAYGLSRLGLVSLPAGAKCWRLRLCRLAWVFVATLAVVSILACLVYPVLAVPTRAREYGRPPTLDGAAYLHELRPADFAAIEWLNQSVAGVPVILEAPGDRFDAYVYEGRVSAFTGLPTLLGWGGHEHQWRGNYDEPALREPDIEALYTTTDEAETLTLLDRYGIRYVYVGPLERSSYPAPGLIKFAELLEAVYESGEVTIYAYAPLEGPTPEREPEP